MKGIIGKKVGMTQVYDEKGTLVPVTVIEAGPCVVLDVKTQERDGYTAVQVGFGSRKVKNVTKQVLGMVAKAGLEKNPPAVIKEFRTEGDCFARLLVRMDEIEESLHIIEQLIDNIPEGAYQEKMKPIIRVPEGSWYSAVEGSRGEFGVYLESRGDKTPYRLHYRATGLPLVGVIDTITRGAKIADLIAIGGTLDYVVPDIDR